MGSDEGNIILHLRKRWIEVTLDQEFSIGGCLMEKCLGMTYLCFRALD